MDHEPVGPPGTPSLLRAINDRTALRLLADRGPLSRTQLGALAGLSKPTASQLMDRLEAAGLVEPVPELESEAAQHAVMQHGAVQNSAEQHVVVQRGGSQASVRRSGTASSGAAPLGAVSSGAVSSGAARSSAASFGASQPGDSQSGAAQPNSAAPGPGTPGRTARRYRLRGGAAHVAGLDVTSARIVARVCDLAGSVVGEATLPTPGRSATGTVDRVREALAAACAPAGLQLAALHHAVIGIGGAIDPGTGRLGFARHLPGWHEPDLLARLRTELTPPGAPNPRVDVENDVNLAAVAEQTVGAAAPGGPGDPHPGARDFVILWIAEGIGAAVVIDGRLHRGATGGAGEVGYMPVPGAPLVRSIGRGTTGGFQALAGGPAVLKLARRHGFTGAEPQIAVARAAEVVEASARPGASGVTGAAGASGTSDAPGTPAAQDTAQDSAQDAAQAARRLLAELADRLATGLAPIVAVLDPELIVLTGAILRAGAAPLRELIAEVLHGMAIPRPRLVTSAVADNPVLAGAIQAALAATREAVFSSTLPSSTSVSATA